MKTYFALALTVILLAGISTTALAQSDTASSEAVTSSLKRLHTITLTNIVKTAEMLDEEMYAYGPTDEVRTTGQLLAHIAGAQFMFCSTADGADNPSQENFEETATSKEDILAALEAASEYCNSVYDGMTDEAGATMRSLFGMELAASAVLAFNSAHNYEHYGNLVTYMRMNDIVPPSSM